MPGTFFGIEIGRSGLAAAQVGQNVTGHNIANAGTPGYSVQSVHQVATDLIGGAGHESPLPGQALGSGVAISRIQRANDQFLDTQVRDASASHSYQAGLTDTLNQISSAFGEPGTTGLNSALSAFFNGFQDLANNAEDIGSRATAIQSGAALGRIFQGVQARLTSLGSTLSQNVDLDVKTLNDNAAQIAALNITIKQETAAGNPISGVLDQRDILLDKISALANVTTQNNADGTVNVSIGTQGLVVGTDAYAATLASLTAKGDLKQGALAGLVDSQSRVTAVQASLNTLAGSLAAQVNAIHRAGVGLDGTTGEDFFTVTPGSEAATLTVNPDLQAHPEHLAAAALPAPPASAVPPQSDATNAVLLANLKNQTSTTPGDPLAGSSIQGFYHQLVTDTGGRAASAKAATASSGAVLTQLTQQRSSVTGVSTDDEMVNMLKYQRAYQASARVVQTMDDMIGTLINNLFSGR